MGILIDGIIGPILESLDIIEIGKDGEWKKREHETKRPSTQEKKPEKKTHWFETIRGWFNGLIQRIKKLLTRADSRNKELVASIPEPKSPIAYEPLRIDRISKKTLKKISKWEGKSLISKGYQIWYGKGRPDDCEIKEEVVYVVEGGGEPVSNAAVLGGIRYDAYYIWDKEKDTEKALNETRTRLDRIRKEQTTETINNAVIESFAKDKELCDAVGIDNEALRADLEEHNRLREEARKMWVNTDVLVDDKTGIVTIKTDPTLAPFVYPGKRD